MGGRTVERGRCIVNKTLTLAVRHVNWDTDLAIFRDGVRDFWGEVHMLGECRPEYFIENMKLISEGANNCAVVLEEDDIPIGATAGFLGPCPYNGDLIFNEMFIYLIPTCRGLAPLVYIVDYLKQWARDHGALEIRLGHFGGMNSALSKIYERMGFDPWHTGFRQRLL